MKKQKLLIALIKRYRELLYLCHRRSSKGLMPKGIPCQVEDPEADITHSDVVHPCVRYIKEGFEGHQWWMVYTPYYGGDEHMENPRLCYADTDNDTPPTNWKYYCTIKEQPEYGYNSDPTMLFHNGNLYVFWRECHTPDTDKIGCNFATFGCVVRNKTTIPLQEVLIPNIVAEVERSHDREVCPTFMVIDNKLKAFAMHHKFNPDFVYWLPVKLVRALYRYRLFDMAAVLGIYNRIKNIGVSVWDGESFGKQFRYTQTVKFEDLFFLYQPWHMDLFQVGDDKILYAVVQTSLYFADICLAYCNDGGHFNIVKKPLLTDRTIGMSGLYKPTAVKVDDNFCLYYTARDKEAPGLNRLFVTTINWDALSHYIH